MTQRVAMSEGPIIIFDGVCNLCDRVVQFILARDPGRQFRFAALQSSSAQGLLQRYGVEAEDSSTIVLIARGIAYTKSDAVLRIATRLSGLWPVLKVFFLVPRLVRNWAYEVVARHRYQWCGRKSACVLPSAELRDRFLP